MEYGNENTIFMVNSRPIYPLNVIAGDVEYPDTEQIRSVLAESGGRVYWLEATQKALELGEPIFLNMIMLGALGVIPDFLLDIEDFRNALKDIFPESKLEVLIWSK